MATICTSKDNVQAIYYSPIYKAKTTATNHSPIYSTKLKIATNHILFSNQHNIQKPIGKQLFIKRYQLKQCNSKWL